MCMLRNVTFKPPTNENMISDGNCKVNLRNVEHEVYTRRFEILDIASNFVLVCCMLIN